MNRLIKQAFDIIKIVQPLDKNWSKMTGSEILKELETTYTDITGTKMLSSSDEEVTEDHIRELYECKIVKEEPFSLE